MGKRYVIGDIHGRIKALRRVLQKCDFNYNDDKLIVLGDIVDGGEDTYQVVEELLKINNVIFIKGNHDVWFEMHIKNGWADEIWLQQGGANTLRSYGAVIKESYYITEESLVDITNLNIPVTHQEFFNRGVLYYVEDNMLFVHAGINPKIPKLSSQSEFDLTWDRNLIDYARRGNRIQDYRKVFIGHTTTELIHGTTKPVRYQNLYCMDTGAGWSGKLTILDIDTGKFWQSDIQRPARNKQLNFE